MVGWQQQICLRVRREPGKEHLPLSIGIPSTYKMFPIIIALSIILWLSLLWLGMMGFSCMTFSGKHMTLLSHARHISWIVLSPVPRWHRSPGAAPWVLSKSLRHRPHPHRRAKTRSRDRKIGKLRLKRALKSAHQQFKRKIWRIEKMNEMEWAKRGWEQKMLALVERRMDPSR